MRPCLSSLSYWPQTRVTLLVRSSLVLLLASFLGLDTVAVVSSPVQVQRNTQQHRYCDFNSSESLYTIADLLECMNVLAATSGLKRKTRSPQERINFFPSDESTFSNREGYNPPHRDTYNNQPANHRGPVYPSNRPDYYAHPPALPPGYQSTPGSSFSPGIFGINLVDALSSISQYDDRKCVPRIICEVATGSVPGNSGYKQSYASSSMNALISLLTSVDIGGSSPLLNFGKSALMGYANRGNPNICYEKYPQCPRNPNDVVHYLNNYNGGFFRFFSNRNSGIRYRNAKPPLDTLISDRKGTGELKFDTTAPRMQSGKLEDKNIYTKGVEYRDEKQIVFPDDQRLLNRFTKSLNYRDHSSIVPSIFTEDKMNNPTLREIKFFEDTKKNAEQNEFKRSTPRLYITENSAGENLKSFTFPDGQRVMIDIGFTKLFSEGYKKMLKRGLMNDEPQPINMEGLHVINLAELYAEDNETQMEQVIHPCDMICHDSRGTAVQFSQIISSGRLSTLMTPERPILDLSELLPCEVRCLTNRGERRQISTTLDKVIKPQKHNEGLSF